MSRFISRYGGIYEHSPWVAERVVAMHGKLDDIGQIRDLMAKVVDDASTEEKVKLIQNHPELVIRQQDQERLTPESRQEQKNAGLDSFAPEDVARFAILNKNYREKFGFPFVIAVWGKTQFEILAAFESRIRNDLETEFSNAMNEIHKIASMRLERMEAGSVDEIG